MNEEATRALAPFLDGEGRLLQYPARRKKKDYALAYLAEKFAPDRDYTQAEVNDLLEAWHCFHDPATLRRELYNASFLDRTPDGRVYRLAARQPAADGSEQGNA